MLEGLLASCYLLTLAAMTRNLVRIKLQNDFEEEIKRYREYDLATDPIKPGDEEVDLDGNYVVLVNHKADSENKAPFFSHTQTYANILDPTRMFTVSFKADLTCIDKTKPIIGLAN